MLYYFLTTSFTPLDLKIFPQMSFQQLKALLDENLSPKDQVAFRDYLFYIDLKNVKSLLAEKPIDPRGFFSEKELREALLVQEDIPEYMQDFLQKFAEKEMRLRHFTSLYAQFFRQERKGFLQKYFSWQRELRLVITALRAKKWGKDLTSELQFEEVGDPFAMHLLAQKDAKELDVPERYAPVKALFQKYINQPKELEKQLLIYQLQVVEEFEEGRPFSVDAVLGYAARLYLIESWWMLDEANGKTALKHIV